MTAQSTNWNRSMNLFSQQAKLSLWRGKPSPDGRSKTHKRLKESFLIRSNRTKRANFRGNLLSLSLSCVFWIFFQNDGSQLCFRFSSPDGNRRTDNSGVLLWKLHVPHGNEKWNCSRSKHIDCNGFWRHCYTSASVQISCSPSRNTHIFCLNTVRVLSQRMRALHLNEYQMFEKCLYVIWL